MIYIDKQYQLSPLVPVYLFSATGVKTVENITGAHEMVDGGIGTKTIPANTIKAGTTFNLKSMGLVSTEHALSTSSINISLGSVNLVSSTVTLPRDLDNTLFIFDYTLTFKQTGVSGSAIGQGRTIVAQPTSSTAITRPLLMTGDRVIDTTIDNTFYINYTWESAHIDNSVTTTNALIERIY